MPKIYEILTENHLKLVFDKHMMMYSSMQPIDVSKLLYQALYGPAHMTQDHEIIRANILLELSAQAGIHGKMMEDIGANSGYVRINFPIYLNVPDPDCRKMRIDNLVNWILASCEDVCDDNTTLHTHWYNLLPYLQSKLTAKNSLWEDATQIVLNNAIPSHSPIYRELYHPHYRIVKPTLTPYSDLYK